ncbi:MAG: hypothetical protein FWC80_05285 [Firmicutes bacterium]|nr:hypothetical protein [Bacillota bacterium]
MTRVFVLWEAERPTPYGVAVLRSTEGIARSVSDEAISRIGHFTWDCFVANASRNRLVTKPYFRR